MSTIPFHVAGGGFHGKEAQKPGLDTRFLKRQSPDTLDTPEKTGSRRRKLWDVPHKFHCPIIGTCFDVDALRTLMAKSMHFPVRTTDFVLHTTAVGACESRSSLAELLQKSLEKQYQQTIRRFAAAKDVETLRRFWQQATASGIEIPGALWASWTHPACDTLLEQEIYGDIHMIQHQVGTGARADLATLKHLRSENAQLRQECLQYKQEASKLRDEKARDNLALSRNLSELRIELAGKEASLANLTVQHEKLRHMLPDLKDREALARRANDAESRAVALGALAAEQESKLAHMQELLRRAEESIQQLLANDEPFIDIETPATAPDHAKLSGKCVLCVGGRSGSVDGYRQIVEGQGGRFLHHDGGLEESLHRIDAALLAADLVVCQAGCISHNAYWRVKEQCKRTGKQCVFVKNSGISSFERLVSDVCDKSV